MNIALRQFVHHVEASSALRIALGVGLLFICSQLTIPLPFVPITMQTIAVLFIGLTYSSREAFLAHGVFLGGSALGLPMLAKFSGGAAVFAGTTGGYLIGFIVAATAIAFLREQLCKNELNWKMAALFSFLGMGIIFLLGIAWLSYLIGFESAVKYGLMPFILPGILKNVILVSLLAAFKPLWHKASQ